MSKGDLTPRQRIFVRVYEGNATKAAIAAGCTAKTAPVTGSKWLKLPKVRNAIQRRDAGRSRASIADRNEVQESWTKELRSAKNPLTRLKAGELLEKSRGGFTQKLEVQGELGLIDLIAESMGRSQADKYRPLEAPKPAAEPPEEPKP